MACLIWYENKQFWFCLQGTSCWNPSLVELSRPQFKKRCITKFVIMKNHTTYLELDWFYWYLTGSGNIGNNTRSAERKLGNGVQLYTDTFWKFIFCFHQINCISAHTHTHTFIQTDLSLIYVSINEHKHINELMDSVSVCPEGMRAEKSANIGKERGKNKRYEKKTKHQKHIKKARGQK